jgi:hypothetical protein
MSSADVQKRQTWEARIRRYRSSGLSVARFCVQEGVSTHAFYYWAKRLRAASGRRPPRVASALRPACSSATPTTGGNAREAVVRFRWSTGAEVLAPAGCLAAIRCLAECLAKAGDYRSEAFQEVVVKA